MKFLYTARNKEGQVKQGLVVAATAVKAEQLLAENGMIITNLVEQQEGFWARNNPFDKTVNTKDLVMFTRQMATLISARVPILQSLRILESQVENKALVSITRDLTASVENGESLSLALSKHPEVFAEIYVSLIKSGEATGSLSKSLVYLAEQMEKENVLRSKVKGALTYPLFVLVTLGAVAMLMFKFVLPNLIGVLEEQGGELPLASIVLIAVTHFFEQYWYLVLLGIAVVLLAIRFYVKSESGRYQFDLFKIRVPIFKNLFIKIYLARFARSFATLISGGIPIIQAVKIVSELVGNVIYRDTLLDAAKQLATGKSVSESLSDHEGFPVIVTQMISVGEQTAKLDEILLKLAEFYEQEVDQLVNTLTTLLEPLIMIILGIAVGGLVAGVLLPIYNLASTVG